MELCQTFYDVFFYVFLFLGMHHGRGVATVRSQRSRSAAYYGLEISHHLERKPKHHMVKLRHLFGTQPNECYYVCTHILSTITTMARYTIIHKRKPKVFIQVKSGCFCVLQLPTSRCWQSKNMSHFPKKMQVY